MWETINWYIHLLRWSLQWMPVVQLYCNHLWLDSLVSQSLLVHYLPTDRSFCIGEVLPFLRHGKFIFLTLSRRMWSSVKKKSRQHPLHSGSVGWGNTDSLHTWSWTTTNPLQLRIFSFSNNSRCLSSLSKKILKCYLSFYELSYLFGQNNLKIYITQKYHMHLIIVSVEKIIIHFDKSSCKIDGTFICTNKF